MQNPVKLAMSSGIAARLRGSGVGIKLKKLKSEYELRRKYGQPSDEEILHPSLKRTTKDSASEGLRQAGYIYYFNTEDQELQEIRAFARSLAAKFLNKPAVKVLKTGEDSPTEKIRKVIAKYVDKTAEKVGFKKK